MYQDSNIINLADHPELMEQAARWNHEKWGVPVDAYLDSMHQACQSSTGVPAWYVVMEGEQIIAGIGIIENDFHQRPDLTPNLCAVYVEPPYRMQGLARLLLNHACQALAAHGIHDAYLITDHERFYEKCGWRFYGMIKENSGGMTRMYHCHT